MKLLFTTNPYPVLSTKSIWNIKIVPAWIHFSMEPLNVVENCYFDFYVHFAILFVGVEWYHKRPKKKWMQGIYSKYGKQS